MAACHESASGPSFVYFVLSWDALGISVAEVGSQRPVSVAGCGFLPLSTVALPAPGNNGAAQNTPSTAPCVTSLGSRAIASHCTLPGLYHSHASSCSMHTPLDLTAGGFKWAPMQPTLPFAFPHIVSTHEGAVAALDTGGELWTAPPPDTPQASQWTLHAARLLTPVATLTDPAPVFHCVTAGWQHTLAVDASGGVWAWGGDAHGQCGPGVSTVGVSTEGVSGGASTPMLVGAPRPMQLPQVFRPGGGSARICAVSAAGGAYHTLLLTREGGVWGCGWGGHGQLGLGSPMQCISAVRGAAATDADRPGDGPSAPVVQGKTPEGGGLLWIGTPPNTTQGGVFPFKSAELAPVEGLHEPVTRIAASGTASVAITASGELVVWGGHVPGWAPPSAAWQEQSTLPLPCGDDGPDVDLVLLPGRDKGGAGGLQAASRVELIPCVPLPTPVPLGALLQQELPTAAATAVQAVDSAATAFGVAVLLRGYPKRGDAPTDARGGDRTQ